VDSTAAKQFLISKVIEQANVERVHLSNVEKRMLSFSEAEPETVRVLPEFEQQYPDSEEFETKISALLRNARERELQQSPGFEQLWNEAISALKYEDHYILVMVYEAFPRYRQSILPDHRFRDFMIYLAVGITLLLGCFVILLIRWSR
jgi:hypothetical protein